MSDNIISLTRGIAILVMFLCNHGSALNLGIVNLTIVAFLVVG